MNLDKLYGGIAVLDGSVLIGLALAEEHFEPLKRAIINEQMSPLTHELAVIELLYIICRKASMDAARQKFDLLKGSGLIDIVPTNMLLEDAASIKCKRKLALADCFTIALAVKTNSVAVFAKIEKELKEEIKREPFTCDMYFVLEDLLLESGKTINEKP
mgnify:CR=1 FL=1